MARKKKSQNKKVDVEEEDVDLNRFAGSSDEEENEEEVEMKFHEHTEHPDANDEDGSLDEEEDKGDNDPESSGDDDAQDDKDDDDKDDDDNSGDDDSDPEESWNPSSKMSNAMARILGNAANSTSTSSVVLAKTTTPLQKMQKKEKEEMKAQREKRVSKLERNLTALHIPLSVATTNTVDDGRLSVSKELERERFHRRVATRGVVALFNAISKHQKSTEEEIPTKKRKEATKLTKHGFLDKIKSAAVAAGTDKTKNSEESGKVGGNEKGTAKWMKDDFMLNPKKNWDQESSDEASGIGDEPLEAKELDTAEENTKKKPRTGKKQ